MEDLESEAWDFSGRGHGELDRGSTGLVWYNFEMCDSPLDWFVDFFFSFSIFVFISGLMYPSSSELSSSFIGLEGNVGKGNYRGISM